MNLYSYYYLTQNHNIVNYILLVFAILIGGTIIFSGFKYFRDRTNLKYRDLFVTLLLFAVLIVSIQVSHIQVQESNNNRTGQTATILKNISKSHHVPLKHMYTNSTTLTNGMTIKAGKNYYQANFNSDFSGYSLTRTDLIYNQPNYIRSNQINWNITNDQYTEIALKLLIGFIMLVVQINLSGKGNLAPSNAIDQLQNYVLGGIIGGMIYNQDITILQFFIVLLIWSIIIFGSKLLIRQSTIFKRILTGNPQTIIANGKIQVDQALRNSLSASDLAFKLRSEGVNNFQEVKNAVLEQNGRFTITKYGTHSINYPLITDGNIDETVLKQIGKDKQWLLDTLKLKKQDLESIYLGQFVNGTLILVTYPEHKHPLLDRYKIKIPGINTKTKRPRHRWPFQNHHNDDNK